MTVDAALLTAVTRNCTTIGEDDFESFATAFAVGAGMELGTVAHFEIDAGELPEDLGFPTEWDFPFLTVNFPLFPTNGTAQQQCFVLVDDTPAATPSNSTVNAAAPANLAGVPAATGTMYPAASAVPTWNFTKIESYYSANGHLPTNVNYQQMISATTVPTQILPAVQALTSNASRSTPLFVWVTLAFGFSVGAALV